MAPPVNLDRRVTIQSATEARDSYGEPIKTWADFAADLPAQYMPVSGDEQFQAQQVLATARAKFRIRYRTDLTRAMRVVFDSVNWDLRHFEEDMRYSRKQYMVLTCDLKTAT